MKTDFNIENDTNIKYQKQKAQGSQLKQIKSV